MAICEHKVTRRGLGSLLNFLYLSTMRLKSTTERVEEIVNPSTGEVITQVVTTSKTFTTRVKSEGFYMTFYSALEPLIGKLSITDRELIDQLSKWAEYDTGKVFLPSQRKEELCEILNIKKQSLYNSLSNLKSKGLIDSKKGVATINPMFFWKGTAQAREKLLANREIYLSFGIVDEFEKDKKDND